MSMPTKPMDDDITDILAAIARQEADEKLAQELAAQFAKEASLAPKPPVQPKKPEEDTKALSDEQIARELDAQFKQETSLSRKPQPQPEKEIKAKSDAKLALELQQQFEQEFSGHQADGDYAFALQTQFQLEKSKSPSLQHDIKESADAALARALQGMEDEGTAGLSEEMLEIYKQLLKRWEGKTAEERKKIEESLKTILASPAVAGEQGTTGLTNAHKFTSTLIRAGIPILTNIDDQFKLSSIDLTPDVVLKEVLEFLEKMIKDGIDSRISIENIQKTFGHIRSNAAVDASESQANAHHLLSRTWTLAKKMGRDGMTAVATLLSDNIGDGGSCIPGLIARLYSPYAKMLAIQLGVEARAPSATEKPVAKAK